MKKNWLWWILSLLAAICCLWINNRYFRVAEMIQLEFSRSAVSMHQHILSIGCSPSCCYQTLEYNTYVDFGFLVCYSFLTFFSFRLFLDVFQLKFRPWVYIFSFATGVLDIIENCFLLGTAVKQQEIYSWVFAIVVRVKWAFALVPLLLIPIIIFYGIIMLLRGKR